MRLKNNDWISTVCQRLNGNLWVVLVGLKFEALKKESGCKGCVPDGGPNVEQSGGIINSYCTC